jgi:hypothetical protein
VLAAEMKLSKDERNHDIARFVLPAAGNAAPPPVFEVRKNHVGWHVVQMPVPPGISARWKEATGEMDTIAEEVAADLYEHPYQVQASVNRLWGRLAAQPAK